MMEIPKPYADHGNCLLEWRRVERERGWAATGIAVQAVGGARLCVWGVELRV